MAHYFFQAQYRGATLTDDIGEEFATLHEAEAHATVSPRNSGATVRSSPQCLYSARMENCWRSAAISN